MAKEQYYGTGRRKSSVARVRLVPGNGKITINGRTIDEYFGLDTLKLIVRQPLELTKTTDKFDVIAKVEGGGFVLHSSQKDKFFIKQIPQSCRLWDLFFVFYRNFATNNCGNQ